MAAWDMRKSRIPTKPKVQTCPKHKTRLMLRQNAKTGELALSWPYCDVEKQGGGEKERKIIYEVLDKFKAS